MKIADSVDIPIIIYNVPGRCGTDILSDTVAQLADHPNIVGLKEATGELKRSSELVSMCPDDFVVLSGDDINTLPILSVGGKGVISVVANVDPADIAETCNAFKAGNIELARKLHYKTMQLAVDLFIETNPIPAKTALMLMGKLNGKLRLPLAPLTPANQETLRQTLKDAGLIELAMGSTLGLMDNLSVNVGKSTDRLSDTLSIGGTAMEYRGLGTTGLTVSEIGMGTWELGGREWGDIDEAVAIRLLQYAYEQGVTLYDTADQYGGGRSERLLGQAFANMQNSVVIATKVGYEIDSDGWVSQGWEERPSYNASRDYIRTSVEGKFTAIGTRNDRHLPIPCTSASRTVG